MNEHVPDYLEQKKINNHGELERIRVRGTHEPIVTEEEYSQVMDRFENKVQMVNKQKIGLRGHVDVWGRKLICCCGKSFRRVKYHTASGAEKQYAYQCGGQIATGTVKTRLKKKIVCHR